MAKNSPKKVVPWFGSNTKLAPVVGKMLGPLRWCGVPFCGGCSEIKHIDTRIGVANDLHQMAMNLYQVIASPILLNELVEILCSQPYHQTTLSGAQIRCMASGGVGGSNEFKGGQAVRWSVEAAADYFMASWLGRKGKSGTMNEFKGGLAVRWSSEGGDPVMEYNNAVSALLFWRDLFKNWAFLCMDGFQFIRKVKDQEGHGLYVDAPWPDAGGDYRHSFGESHHRTMATILGWFKKTRVLVRFGDHPLIRRLYPEGPWRWEEFSSKNQGHKTIVDVLISNWDADTAGLDE